MSVQLLSVSERDVGGEQRCAANRHVERARQDCRACRTSSRPVAADDRRRRRRRPGVAPTTSSCPRRDPAGADGGLRLNRRVTKQLGAGAGVDEDAESRRLPARHDARVGQRDARHFASLRTTRSTAAQQRGLAAARDRNRLPGRVRRQCRLRVEVELPPTPHRRSTPARRRRSRGRPPPPRRERPGSTAACRSTVREGSDGSCSTCVTRSPPDRSCAVTNWSHVRRSLTVVALNLSDDGCCANPTWSDRNSAAAAVAIAITRFIDAPTGPTCLRERTRLS